MKTEKRGRMITATHVRKLLASQPYVVDSELQKRVPGEPLLLQDGQLLLLLESGKGTLYPSRTALIELMDHVEALAKQGPVDPKKSLLPTTATFLANVKEYADQLSGLIGVRGTLDGSESSLKLVDEAILVLPKAQRMSPRLVTSLVAYVGEMMRNATGGSWTQTTQVGGQGEPIVMTRTNSVLQPFAIVYEELLRGRRGSLQGAVNGVLRIAGS